MQNRPLRLHVSWWHERLVDLYEGIRHLHEADNTTQTTIRGKYYYIGTPPNGHLCNTVTSLLLPLFFDPAKRPYNFLQKKKTLFDAVQSISHTYNGHLLIRRPHSKLLNYRIFYNFTPLMRSPAKLKFLWHVNFIDLLLADPVLI